MTDQLDSDQHQNTETFLSKSAVIFVRIFGSWGSVAVHTLIFASWFIFNWDLERLLVIVSIEAIYIGIFILMAENIETIQREQQRERKRLKDIAMVKEDVAVDKQSLKEIQEVNQKIDQVQKIIKIKK